MTAINSIRASRGPITAVPVVAGKGVRLVADTENNRWVVEADETVLWEGSYTSGTAIQMSEAFANFDEIKVFYKSNDNLSSVFRFSPADNTLPYLNLFSYWVPSAKNSLSVKGSMFTLTSDTIVFTRGISGNTPGTITEASPITITRVVGVNRIASN